MIHPYLLHPRSIAVIGGSNDIHKPGGKVLKNLIDGKYRGSLYIVNPKEASVQGQQCYNDVAALPETDLAVIAIAAKYVPETMRILVREKNTRAFIVLSAGFSESGHAGKKLEEQLVSIANEYGASLIGPNAIGVLTPAYHGVFTEPVPPLDPKGCDLISGSGATAVFILEAGIPKGLRFANIFSVGNSAQLGVEEILEHLDNTFDPASSAPVKLLYIEKIDKPQKLLRHASSLIRKGCRIAAVKAGASEAGSRAASSHTGALASSDTAVDALFKKAGIVRCDGREDLIAVACAFNNNQLRGNRFAVITHAGGPAVMLTDALSKGGFSVPKIDHPKAEELLNKLFPGSSVANPIDFLATGTAEQLSIIIDYVEKYFTDIDAMAVIFGTPGLVEVFDAYAVLHEKMQTCSKPIYPVLPSVITAHREVEEFVKRGHTFFPDEVLMAKALTKIYQTPQPVSDGQFSKISFDNIPNINSIPEGYLSPILVAALLDSANIPRVKERETADRVSLLSAAKELRYPLVLKIVGPVHKSEVGGVALNITSEEKLLSEFDRLMSIPGARGVLVQPMISGIELFAGVKYEEGFGHIIVCGAGGIYVEVLKDITYGLAPLSSEEAVRMIRSLKIYPILKGARGQQPVDENLLADILVRLSALVTAAPWIVEMDINPLLAAPERIVAVDARVKKH
ncbi:acetate--CoA ligase family protein [bacterium]|nr:acetate--CoA ligase family protein [bacterium]